MTYIQHPSRRRRTMPMRRRRAGMGNVFDLVEELVTGKPGSTDIRNALCSVSPGDSVGELDAQLAEIDRTWNPTGFFTAQDIDTVFGQVSTVVSAAVDQIESMFAGRASSIGSDNLDELHRLEGKLNEATNDKFQPFIAAVQEANAKGLRAINAPGLKSWAMTAMKAARDLMRQGAVIECQTSALETAIRKVSNVVIAVGQVLRTVVGIVLEAGEAAVDAIDFTFQLLKFAKWAVLLGGGYYVVKKIRERM